VTTPGTRDPAVAGTFYPSDPDELAGTIDGLLAGAASDVPAEGLLGLIVPHAGYPYSGRVAASAYALLAASSRPSRVAVLGPAHFTPLSGLALPAAASWRTPLGHVAIDTSLREGLAGLGALVDDGPHEGEHAVEVQLPFLQRVVGPDVHVLPVAVGSGDAETAARFVEAVLWNSFVIVSTDLSHYLPLARARAVDRATADAILARDLDAIGSEAACGVHALRGLVACARNRGLRLSLLDLRTSGDISGDPSSVVGYGAFALLG
jgi:AmmeMemoRadiSam system protein B